MARSVPECIPDPFDARVQPRGPGGKYSKTEGLTDAAACLQCSIGKYRSNAVVEGPALLTECSLCAEGTYSADKGQEVCTSCAAGKYSMTVGAFDPDGCSSCSPGKTSNEASTSEYECFNCPRGTFAELSGSSTCTSCLKNADSPSGSATESDCFCARPGYYGDGVVSCDACPEGKYGSGNSQIKCLSLVVPLQVSCP